MNLFLDIETVPEGAPALDGLADPSTIVVTHDDPDLKPDRRLKDPDKKAADIEKKRAALQAKRREEAQKLHDEADAEWRKGSLTPLRGRVLCVGIAVEMGGPKVLMEDTEEETLTKLQQGIEHYRAKARGKLRIWTFNGGSFDRPYLAKRALRHKLYPLARAMRIEKPWLADDLRTVWGMGNNRSRGKLDEVCALLGIGREGNPCSGAEVFDLYQAGELDTIREHCLDDVRVLQLLHQEFGKAGWLE